MERVIIQVQVDSTGSKKDLEVPAEVPAIELASLLAQALSREQGANEFVHSFYIKAQPGGRILAADQTLVQANIWDGATIILKQLPFVFLESEAKHKYFVLFPVVSIGRCARSAGDGCRAADLIDLSKEPGGKTVHRRHVKLTLRKGQWLLSRFREARNVTKVNDQPLQPGRSHPLSDGDRIILGKVQLWFHEG